jgi:flagellar biosynthesis protein FliQ
MSVQTFVRHDSPVNVWALADALIGLSGAAIAATFAIVVAVMVTGFVVTLVVSVFRLMTM